MRRIVLAVALLAGDAGATVAYGLRTPDRIVMVADSRRTFPVDGHVTDDACKLGSAGGRVYGLAGMTWLPSVGFDAHALARDIVGVASTAEAGAALVARAAHPVLRCALLAARERDEHVEPRTYQLSIMVGEMVNGAPRLLWVKAEGDLEHPALEPAEVAFVPIGQADESSDPLGPAGRAAFIRQHGPVGALRLWAIQEILRDPREPAWVAGPLDVLELDANGARWLHVKPGCDLAPDRHLDDRLVQPVVPGDGPKRGEEEERGDHGR